MIHVYLLDMDPPPSQVHGLKMIVKNSQDLSSCRSLLLDALGSSVSTTNKQTSSHENVAEQISDLKVWYMP